MGEFSIRLYSRQSPWNLDSLEEIFARFLELPGGHCAILEQPDEVNAALRWLAESQAGRPSS